MIGEDRVYHGSPCRDIVTGKFKKGKTGYLGPGIYFSSEKDYTTRYAKKYGSGAIYEVEINLNNPLIINSDNPTKEFLTAVYNTESIYRRREQKQSNICYIIEPKDIKKFLSLGYDGVIWDFAGNKEYVVYDNSNIRIINKEMINESINNDNEVTFYRFLSEMKGFLGRLLNSPINAQPSEFLKRNGFSKTRIINLLLKKDILERNEKILTPDKTGLEKVQYAVSYKVKRKDFERKLKRIYSRYFEKNLPEKKQLNEEANITSYANIIGVASGKGQGVGSEMCDRLAGYVNDSKDKPRSVFKDEDSIKAAMLKDKRDRDAYMTRGGMKGLPKNEETSKEPLLKKWKPIDENDGVTSAENSGQYSKPIENIQRRTIYFTEKQINELKNKIANMGKKVIFTEEQWKHIMECNGIDPQMLDEETIDEATTCASVGAQTTRGDVGYDAPAFDAEKGDDFLKASMTHNKKGGVSCNRLDKNGKAPK